MCLASMFLYASSTANRALMSYPETIQAIRFLVTFIGYAEIVLSKLETLSRLHKILIEMSEI